MPAEPPPAAGSGTPALPDMTESYDVYFRSGLYHSRYPRPNRRTLRLVEQHLPAGGRLLDFGAGEGRYALWLAAKKSAAVLAVDVSAVARSMLEAAAARQGLADRIEVVDADAPPYRAQAIGGHDFDVALLGFGVLGHIAGRAQRRSVLRDMRSCLKPSGRLVMGLPNAARRFRAEQAAAAPLVAAGTLEPGDILYARDSGAGNISLYYHLFHPDEIRADLRDAGFAIDRLTLESVMPERAVTTSRGLAVLDDALSAITPLRLGYGYLVVARPA
ncbi:class I SAM-dependent methyltransferase [Kaistia algarum]|uniref:class I SAM-dependent methyltransferase n=1 Tax=Kaistia algarum TaxID=2083279 RepID=UPI00140251ED|nr:class I SAM-dependent methyltransferase [Kaistia algarum]MCX5515845.1 class I SAM-dependent methyltransferase [Kaistia algarum]